MPWSDPFGDIPAIIIAWLASELLDAIDSIQEMRFKSSDLNMLLGRENFGAFFGGMQLQDFGAFFGRQILEEV